MTKAPGFRRVFELAAFVLPARLLSVGDFRRGRDLPSADGRTNCIWNEGRLPESVRRVCTSAFKFCVVPEAWSVEIDHAKVLGIELMSARDRGVADRAPFHLVNPPDIIIGHEGRNPGRDFGLVVLTF